MHKVFEKKICKDEKKEIELGIKQANEGKLVSHESIMAKLKKWH